MLNLASRRSVAAVVVMTAACSAAPADRVGVPVQAPSDVIATGEDVAAPSPPPMPVVESPPAPVRAGIDVDLAVGQALALVDIGERLPGTTSGSATTEAIAEAFWAAGWDVEFDPFDLPQGGTASNVIASWGGRGRDGPHVLVGGHWDTVPGTVGANDNASGIGVLVALAHELADEAADLAIPVVLVAFGAEEYQGDTGVHHVGSEHLASRDEDVIAMLAVDMVGNGVETLVVGLDGTRDDLVTDLVAVAAAAGMADVRAISRGDISDHGPFARRGVPAAFLWTGRDGRLHTAADTAEHLDPDDLARAGDLVLAWLRGLTSGAGEG